MGWEEMYIGKESAKCACGKGEVVRDRVYEGDDFYGRRDYSRNEKIICEECRKKYVIEHIVKHSCCPSWKGDGISDIAFLVPKGEPLKIQVEPQSLPYESSICFDKNVVARYSENDLKKVIDDMKANHYTTRLKLSSSREVVALY